MARPPKEDSVKKLVALLEIDETVSFDDGKIFSIAAQVSQLKQSKDHSEKKFKVSSSDKSVTVKRLKL